MTNPSPAAAIPCPVCGTVGSGRFCSACGAVLSGAVCLACRAELAPGARFCHRCGTPVGAPVGATAAARDLASSPTAGSTSPARSRLPLTLVALAVVALVIILVAQRAARDDPNAMPASGTPLSQRPAGTAPDISSMSPRERVDRLYDRIMRLADAGKQDSVEMFATMAIPAFAALGTLDDDTRYDLGRIAELSRNFDIAAAQADTILRGSSTHLLGLILAARVAEARGNQAERDRFERRLLDAEASERRKALDEYTRHSADIDAAVAAARTRQR